MSTPPTDRSRITITQPDDWHLHLRDGDAMAAVLPATARRFRRAIVMPNLKPPITSVAAAQAYRERILAAREQAAVQTELELKSEVGYEVGPQLEANAIRQFEPLMTLYLTDRTTVTDVFAAKASGLVHGIKLYPAGATTHSDAGVTDLGKLHPTLAAMQSCGLPFLVHGEVTDPSIDIFDREAVFIDRVLQPLRKDFPALKIVFEHATTREAVQWVRESSGPVAATLTPQHLLYDRNALFVGGIRPHWYCLPILKRSVHREALLAAATSGDPKFFLGTDSAPHARGLKEHACGCAGCYTAPHAMELYASAFDSVGALDRLEAFASHHGADFYGLPRNPGLLTLERQPGIVPVELPFVGGERIVPLAAGEPLQWQVTALES
jgi:dihydroorotase